MQAPLLFGVDPDETWKYVTEACRAAKLTGPRFILKAPRLALATKRSALLIQRLRRVEEIAPGTLAALRELSGDDGKIKADATPEEIATFAEANAAWGPAWAAASAEVAEELAAVEAQILSESLTGWEDLTTRTGKPLDFAAMKGRLEEVLPSPQLREELAAAICKGATLSDEDAEGLPSSQVSSAA